MTDGGATPGDASGETTPGDAVRSDTTPGGATCDQPSGRSESLVHMIDDVTAIVDLQQEGRSSVIGVGVLKLDGERGVALVDPGPEARLGALRARLAEVGAGLRDVRAVLLTHIHLDHAVATGAIVEEAPEVEVYVHPRGAPHMVDPSRLVASATRIYGDAMETLWGRVVPVPEASLREVDQGDSVEVGGRRLEVAYVPGHAKHHVAYYEEAAGTLWAGDAGGVRIGDGPSLPVTPPPDIDVEAWNESIDRMTAWRPRRIVTAHFGVHEDPAAHFAELKTRLAVWAKRVRESLENDASDADRAQAFAERLRAELGPEMPDEMLDSYAVASGFSDSWWGLARYWRKRQAAERS